MIDFDNDNLAKNLPDSFAKDSDSNNYKILENERCAVAEHLDDIWDIYTILDLDNATGATLDNYGDRVGQARGQAGDSKYLLMIKAKIMRNLGNGTYPSVLKSMMFTFGCTADEVSIEEADEPYRIDAVKLPLDVLNSCGMTSAQVIQLIKSVLPIGITIDVVSLEGTFEFSDGESDYDEEKGFNDVEGGSLGGYLGYLSSDENEPILPI